VRPASCSTSCSPTPAWSARTSSSRTSSRRGRRRTRPDEVEHHLPWLLAQLDVIQPRIVVPLGRHAMARFVSGVTITEAHGRPVADEGRTIVPWFHPAAAIYNRSLRASLHEDARRLGEMLRG
jgi:DNA polymerase